MMLNSVHGGSSSAIVPPKEESVSIFEDHFGGKTEDGHSKQPRVLPVLEVGASVMLITPSVKLQKAASPPPERAKSPSGLQRIGSSSSLRTHTPKSGGGVVVATDSPSIPIGQLVLRENESEQSFLNRITRVAGAEHNVFRIVSDEADQIDDNTLGKNIGQALRFGDTVRLQHLGTGMYITDSDASDRAVCDKSRGRVTLTPASSARTALASRWTIMPFYKFQGEGIRIRVSDHFMLRASETNAFLSICPVAGDPNVERKLSRSNSNAGGGGGGAATSPTSPTKSDLCGEVCTSPETLHALCLRGHIFLPAIKANAKAAAAGSDPGADGTTVVTGSGIHLVHLSEQCSLEHITRHADTSSNALRGGKDRGSFGSSAAMSQAAPISAIGFAVSTEVRDANTGAAFLAPEVLNCSASMLAQRGMDMGLFSPTRIFVVEAEDVLVGGPVSYATDSVVYRLRVLETSEYLCVTSKGLYDPNDPEKFPFVLSLTTDKDDLSTLMRFHHAVDDADQTLRHRSRVLLEFCHVDAVHQLPEETDPLASLRGMRVASSSILSAWLSLKNVDGVPIPTLSPQASPVDTFQAMIVPQKHVVDVKHIFTRLYALEDYVQMVTPVVVPSQRPSIVVGDSADMLSMFDTPSPTTSDKQQQQQKKPVVMKKQVVLPSVERSALFLHEIRNLLARLALERTQEEEEQARSRRKVDVDDVANVRSKGGASDLLRACERESELRFSVQYILARSRFPDLCRRLIHFVCLDPEVSRIIFDDRAQAEAAEAASKIGQRFAMDNQQSYVADSFAVHEDFLSLSERRDAVRDVLSLTFSSLHALVFHSPVVAAEVLRAQPSIWQTLLDCSEALYRFGMGHTRLLCIAALGELTHGFLQSSAVTGCGIVGAVAKAASAHVVGHVARVQPGGGGGADALHKTQTLGPAGGMTAFVQNPVHSQSMSGTMGFGPSSGAEPRTPHRRAKRFASYSLLTVLSTLLSRQTFDLVDDDDDAMSASSVESAGSAISNVSSTSSAVSSTGSITQIPSATTQALSMHDEFTFVGKELLKSKKVAWYRFTVNAATGFIQANRSFIGDVEEQEQDAEADLPVFSPKEQDSHRPTSSSFVNTRSGSFSASMADKPSTDALLLFARVRQCGSKGRVGSKDALDHDVAQLLKLQLHFMTACCRFGHARNVNLCDLIIPLQISTVLAKSDALGQDLRTCFVDYLGSTVLTCVEPSPLSGAGIFLPYGQPNSALSRSLRMKDGVGGIAGSTRHVMWQACIKQPADGSRTRKESFASDLPPSKRSPSVAPQPRRASAVMLADSPTESPTRKKKGNPWLTGPTAAEAASPTETIENPLSEGRANVGVLRSLIATLMVELEGQVGLSHGDPIAIRTGDGRRKSMASIVPNQSAQFLTQSHAMVSALRFVRNSIHADGADDQGDSKSISNSFSLPAGDRMRWVLLCITILRQPLPTLLNDAACEYLLDFSAGVGYVLHRFLHPASFVFGFSMDNLACVSSALAAVRMEAITLLDVFVQHAARERTDLMLRMFCARTEAIHTTKGSDHAFTLLDGGAGGSGGGGIGALGGVFSSAPTVAVGSDDFGFVVQKVWKLSGAQGGSDKSDEATVPIPYFSGVTTLHDENTSRLEIDRWSYRLYLEAAALRDREAARRKQEDDDDSSNPFALASNLLSKATNTIASSAIGLGKLATSTLVNASNPVEALGLAHIDALLAGLRENCATDYGPLVLASSSLLLCLLSQHRIILNEMRSVTIFVAEAERESFKLLQTSANKLRRMANRVRQTSLVAGSLVGMEETFRTLVKDLKSCRRRLGRLCASGTGKKSFAAHVHWSFVCNQAHFAGLTAAVASLLAAFSIIDAIARGDYTFVSIPQVEADTGLLLLLDIACLLSMTQDKTGKTFSDGERANNAFSTAIGGGNPGGAPGDGPVVNIVCDDLFSSMASFIHLLNIPLRQRVQPRPGMMQVDSPDAVDIPALKEGEEAFIYARRRLLHFQLATDASISAAASMSTLGVSFTTAERTVASSRRQVSILELDPIALFAGYFARAGSGHLQTGDVSAAASILLDRLRIKNQKDVRMLTLLGLFVQHYPRCRELVLSQTLRNKHLLATIHDVQASQAKTMTTSFMTSFSITGRHELDQDARVAEAEEHISCMTAVAVVETMMEACGSDALPFATGMRRALFPRHDRPDKTGSSPASMTPRSLTLGHDVSPGSDERDGVTCIDLGMSAASPPMAPEAAEDVERQWWLDVELQRRQARLAGIDVPSPNITPINASAAAATVSGDLLSKFASLRRKSAAGAEPLKPVPEPEVPPLPTYQQESFAFSTGGASDSSAASKPPSQQRMQCYSDAFLGIAVRCLMPSCSKSSETLCMNILTSELISIRSRLDIVVQYLNKRKIAVQNDGLDRDFVADATYCRQVLDSTMWFLVQAIIPFVASVVSQTKAEATMRELTGENAGDDDDDSEGNPQRGGKVARWQHVLINLKGISEFVSEVINHFLTTVKSTDSTASASTREHKGSLWKTLKRKGIDAPAEKNSGFDPLGTEMLMGLFASPLELLIATPAAHVATPAQSLHWGQSCLKLLELFRSLLIELTQNAPNILLMLSLRAGVALKELAGQGATMLKLSFADVVIARTSTLTLLSSPKLQAARAMVMSTEVQKNWAAYVDACEASFRDCCAATSFEYDGAVGEKSSSGGKKAVRIDAAIYDVSLFGTAASYLLRRTQQPQGTVKSIARCVGGAACSAAQTEYLLDLITQIIFVAGVNSKNDITLLCPEYDPIPVEDTTGVTLACVRSLAERQIIIARWKPSVLAKALSLATSQGNTATQDDPSEAALRCAYALVTGGNTSVQSLVLDWARRSEDTLFFVKARNSIAVLNYKFRRNINDHKVQMLARGQTEQQESFGDNDFVAQGSESSLSMFRLQLALITQLSSGNDLGMKEYFCRQPNNRQSVNVLEPLVDLLKAIISSNSVLGEIEAGGREEPAVGDAPPVKNDDTMRLLFFELVSTICALVSASAVNQRFVVSQNIGQFVCDLMLRAEPKGKDPGLPAERVGVLHEGIRLLKAVLDSLDNPITLELFAATLSLGTLVSAMDYAFDQACNTVEANNTKIGVKSFIKFAHRTTQNLVNQSKSLAKGEFSLKRKSRSRRSTTFTDVEELYHESRFLLACEIFVSLKMLQDAEEVYVLAAAVRDQGDGEGSSDDAPTTGLAAGDLISAMRLLDRGGRTIRDALRDAECIRSVFPFVASTEIVNPQDKCVRLVYVRPLVTTLNFSSDLKRRMTENLEVSADVSVRLTNFMQHALAAIREMEHHEKIRQVPGLSVVVHMAPHIMTVALVLSFILNLMLLFNADFMHVPKDNGFDIDSADGFEEAFRGLMLLQVVCQSILFVNFFFGPLLLHINEYWSAEAEENNRLALQENLKNMRLTLPNLMSVDQFINSRPYRVWWFHTIKAVVTWDTVYPMGVFCACSFFAYNTRSPVALAIMNFQVISRSVALYNLVHSIVIQGRTLRVILLMFLCFTMVGALLSFYYFAEEWVPTEGRILAESQKCEQLFPCYMTLALQAPRLDHLEKMLASPSYFGNGGHAYARWINDLVHFIIFQILCRGIILGVLIETFSSLREKKAQSEADWLRRCFVCGLSTPHLERCVPGGFSFHLKQEHRLWDYLFLMHRVVQEPMSSLTASEQHIACCIDTMNVNFFPIARCLSAESMGHHADEDVDGLQDSDNEKPADADDAPAAKAKVKKVKKRKVGAKRAVVGLLKTHVGDILKSVESVVQGMISASNSQTKI